MRPRGERKSRIRSGNQKYFTCSNCATLEASCWFTGRDLFKNAGTTYQFVELDNMNFLWCDTMSNSIPQKTMNGGTYSTGKYSLEVLDVEAIQRVKYSHYDVSLFISVVGGIGTKGGLFTPPSKEEVDAEMDRLYKLPQASFKLFVLKALGDGSSMSYVCNDRGTKPVMVLCPFETVKYSTEDGSKVEELSAAGKSGSKITAKSLLAQYFRGLSCNLDLKAVVIDVVDKRRVRMLAGDRQEDSLAGTELRLQTPTARIVV